MSDEPFPDELAAGCRSYRAAVQSVLDGVLPADALDAPHAVGCPGCRTHAAAARLILAGLRPMSVPQLPTGFADRVVKAALRERRMRAYRRAGAGLAVAVGVLAAVVLTRPAAPSVVPNEQPFAVNVEPVRVEDKLAEAGTALAALTRRTADEALGPTRDLLPPIEPPAFPPAVATEPAVESLSEVPQALGEGFEPVTTSARRAVKLFLRDTGLAAKTF